MSEHFTTYGVKEISGATPHRLPAFANDLCLRRIAAMQDALRDASKGDRRLQRDRL